MIEVHEIRITEYVPGVAQKYVADVRLIDKTSGSYVDDSGLRVYNYDKMFTLCHNDIEVLKRGVEAKIAEVLGESVEEDE